MYRESEISNRTGTRCHICTGCGRCFGGGEGIHVVTEGGLTRYWQEQILAAGQEAVRQEVAGQETAEQDTEKQRIEKQRAEKQKTEKPDGLVAVDIGTTTIAMVLYDKTGKELDRFATVNPQTRFGADVLSRIQAAEEPEKAAAMKAEVCRVLETGAERFCRTLEEALSSRKGEGASEDIILKKRNENMHMVIAANTTMIYLLMGYDPAELGRAPFHASHLEQIHTEIAGIAATILPGLSAFVGADILAGIYASKMAEQEEVTLLIDLGTNGEMAVGNCHRIAACSTAAGPAFEGGATKGVWGADMVHLTAELLKAQILDETGLLQDPYFDEGILIGNVQVTQQGIRNLQLAKAAISAGIHTLAENYGLQDMQQIDRVVLAGGFGYYLKAQDAAAIGLFPNVLADKVITGGNTALAGILRYGLAEEAQKQEMLEKIRQKTTVINLAQQDAFDERYIQAMYLEKYENNF